MSVPRWARPLPRANPNESPNWHRPWTGNTEKLALPGCGGGGASALPRPSAFAVASLTLPVTLRPWARWKSITAAAVPEPKSPSTPPRTEIPALTSADWSLITRVPFSPNTANPPSPLLVGDVGGLGFWSAASVASSTTPLGLMPCDCWNDFNACAVAGPKIPSAPPRTLTPALINASCNDFTVAPSEPDLSPTSPEGPAETVRPCASALAV